MKVAFLDRDGTLIWEPPDTLQIDSVKLLRILPGVLPGLQRLVAGGFHLVMVSNQDALGTPGYPREAFEEVQSRLLSLLRREGITFTDVLICPHAPPDGCNCRKPKTGLVDRLLQDEAIDLRASVMIGDRSTDAVFAQRIGVRYVGMQTNGSFPDVADHLFSA